MLTFFAGLVRSVESPPTLSSQVNIGWKIKKTNRSSSRNTRMAWGNYTATVQALPHTRESGVEEERGGGIRDEAGSSTCSHSLMIHSLVTITITIIRELITMIPIPSGWANRGTSTSGRTPGVPGG